MFNWKEGKRMNINWKVRVLNPQFWVALVPAILILIQAIAALFGFHIEISEVNDKLLAIVNAIFVVLAILGIVNDPTTATFSDSKRAMKYEEPKREDGYVA